MGETMKSYLLSVIRALAFFGMGLILLAPSGARAADVAYSIRPIVKLGDAVADVKIKPAGDLELGMLNDAGQIAVVPENGSSPGSWMLIQYTDDKFIPIVVAGRNAPGGTWAKQGPGPGITGPVSMN
jgi:hypothetical protein